MLQPDAFGIWFLIDRIPAKLFKAMSAMHPDLGFTIRHVDDYRKEAMFEDWTRRHKEAGLMPRVGAKGRRSAGPMP